jgi:putative transposase
VIQNLCPDKGYDDPAGEAASTAAGYVPHIRRIGEEKLDGWGEKTPPARRWVPAPPPAQSRRRSF